MLRIHYFDTITCTWGYVEDPDSEYMFDTLYFDTALEAQAYIDAHEHTNRTYLIVRAKCQVFTSFSS